MLEQIKYFDLQFCDTDGNPLDGGWLTIVNAGTQTKVALFADRLGTTPIDNPVPLVNGGRPETNVFCNPTILIDVCIYDIHGVLTRKWENIRIGSLVETSGITGSGTAGNIPLWISNDEQGDSNLTQAESGVVIASAGFDAGTLLYLGSVELNGVKISTDALSTSDLHLVTAGYVADKYLNKGQLTATQLFGSNDATGRTQFGATAVGGFGKVENAQGQGVEINSYLQGSPDVGYQEILFARAGYGARLSRTDSSGLNKTDFELPPIAGGAGTIALREWVSASYALSSSLASYLPLSGGGMTGTINSNITNGSIPLLIAKIKNQAWDNFKLSQSGELSWGYDGVSATQSLSPSSQTLMTFSHGLQIFGSKIVATTDMLSSYLNLAGGTLTGVVIPNATGLDFGSLTNRWDIFSQDIDASGALTVAGALTANGPVTLGNDSGDDITILGSLVGNVALKTNNSTTIGSSSLRLANLYSTLLNVSGTATMAGVTASGMVTGTSNFNANNHAILAKAATPSYGWHETGATTDEGWWRSVVSGKGLYFSTRNDAGNAGVNWLVVQRGLGTAVTSITFGAPVTGTSSTWSGAVRTQSNTPVFELYQSNGSENSKWWQNYALGDKLYFNTVNDAGNIEANWMRVERSGVTPTLIALDAPLTGTSASFTGNVTLGNDGADVHGLNGRLDINPSLTAFFTGSSSPAIYASVTGGTFTASGDLIIQARTNAARTIRLAGYNGSTVVDLMTILSGTSPLITMAIPLSGTSFAMGVEYFGDSGTLANGNMYAVFTGGASKTLTMNPNPIDKEVRSIKNVSVNNLTIGPNSGQFIVGSTAISGNSERHAIYRASNTSWYIS